MRSGFSVHPSWQPAEPEGPPEWYVQLPVPEGWEKTGEWRVPRREICMSSAGAVQESNFDPFVDWYIDGSGMGWKRFILRKKGQKPVLMEWRVREAIGVPTGGVAYTFDLRCDGRLGTVLSWKGDSVKWLAADSKYCIVEEIKP